MMPTSIKIAVITYSVLAPSVSNAFSPVADMGKSIEKAVQDVGQTIEKSQRETITKIDDERLRQQAELSIKETESQLSEISIKVAKLTSLGKKIEKERTDLAKERDELLQEKNVLLKEKMDVEQREKLFSMGFYAALFTSFVAIFGLFLRLPTSRLDHKLKLLEIEAKEHELAQIKAKTHP